MISIQVLKVRYGDSIIVDIEKNGIDPSNTILLIDSGYNFSNEILPALNQLSGLGKSIDRFIITHFDDDHIRSAAKLIKENGPTNSAKIIPIKQVWLNAYRHLQFKKRPQEEPDEEHVKLLQDFIAINTPESDESTGEISAKQATTLGKELLKFGYSWNDDFDGNAIFVEQKRFIEINPTTKIILLSPQKEHLEKLEDLFETALKEMKINVSKTELIDDAFELFTIKEDQNTVKQYLGKISAPSEISRKTLEYLFEHADYKADDAPGNGSSIAFILEADEKRILFLADAHAETIIKQLQVLYPDKSSYPIFFDAIKVAHHGSFYNNSKDLFELIDSPNFLISTNGGHPSHQHPDAETLAFIVCRPLLHNFKKRNILFNYAPEHLKGFFDEKLMEDLNYNASVSTELILK